MASPFVELEIGGRTVKVTNPDKVFYRKLKATKLDHVQYYVSVAEGIVRALYERPTQLKRHPDGAEGEAIYQKRVPEKRPEWIETARVMFPSGRHADELCVTEVAQVAWAANLATIDFHPWPLRRATSTTPTSCGSTSTRSPARRSRTRSRSRRSSARCSTSSVSPAGRRLPATEASTSPAASSRTGPSRRCAAARWLRAGGRAAAAEQGHDGLVEGGARPARLHRLQPERARPDDRLGLLGARAARRDGLGAGHLGRAP